MVCAKRCFTWLCLHCVWVCVASSSSFSLHPFPPPPPPPPFLSYTHTHTSFPHCVLFSQSQLSLKTLLFLLRASKQSNECSFCCVCELTLTVCTLIETFRGGGGGTGTSSHLKQQISSFPLFPSITSKRKRSKVFSVKNQIFFLFKKTSRIAFLS